MKKKVPGILCFIIALAIMFLFGYYALTRNATGDEISGYNYTSDSELRDDMEFFIGFCKDQKIEFPRVVKLAKIIKSRDHKARELFNATDRETYFTGIYLTLIYIRDMKYEIGKIKIPDQGVAKAKADIEQIVAGFEGFITESIKGVAVKQDLDNLAINLDKKLDELSKQLSSINEGFYFIDPNGKRLNVLCELVKNAMGQLDELKKIREDIADIKKEQKNLSGRFDKFGTTLGEVKDQGDRIESGLDDFYRDWKLSQVEKEFVPKHFFALGGGVFRINEKCPTDGSTVWGSLEAGGRLVFWTLNGSLFVNNRYGGGSVGAVIKNYFSINVGAMSPFLKKDGQEIYPFVEGVLELPMKDWLAGKIGVRYYPWNNRLIVQIGLGAF